MTRRFFDRTLAAGVCLIFGPGVFGATEFWNRKDPDSWSSEESQRLLTRSPWAKTVRVDLLRPNPDRYREADGGPMLPPGGAPGGPTGEVPLGGPLPGRGYGPGMVRNRTGTEVPVDATIATVRFDSAEPIREASRKELPPEMAGRYVVGVTAFPMLSPKDDMVDRLRSSATLQAKGKEPAQPGAIAVSKDRSEVLFGFSREFISLNASDKDLVFSLDTGEILLRAHFDPKEMVYRGRFSA